MRNSIIIPTDYENILMIEANKCGLIERNVNLEMEFIRMGMDMDLSMAEFESWLEKKYSRCYKTRQKLFQMILLYDEIIIPASEPDYLYNELERVGNFSLYSFEDFCNYDPTQEEGHLLYAEHLKSAILPVAKKQFKKFFPNLQKGVTLNSIISDIYDFILGITSELNLNTKLSIERNKKIFETLFRDSLGFRFFGEVNETDFYKEVFCNIMSMYEELCWQLDISLKNDSNIINSNYDLSKIGCDIYSKDIKTQHKAYEIIKLECAKTIGNLPHMNNLTDVLTLKEKRKTDIKNLREVLNNLETVIKEQGTENAVIKAANDVQKASKSLSIGNTLADVGKWLTMISVPISVAEVLYSLPPTSSLISVCGAGVCLCEQFYKNKGGWCEVVR